MRLLMILCLSGAALPAPAQSATIRVPADQPTIQDAVNAAIDWDTILVAPGTYFENVTIDRTITLISQAGPEVTTIDGQNLDQVVLINSGVDHVVIEGFRVTHGNSYSGGIASFGSQTIIRRNIVESNRSVGGAAIGADQVLLENNIIQFNNSIKGTGAVEASGTIERNIVRNNEGTGALYSMLVYSSTFAWNVVFGNTPGRHEATFIGGGSIHHNIFVRNNQFTSTVALWSPSQTLPYDFRNNIVLHGNGGGVDCHLIGSDVIRCNDVYGTGANFLDDCAGLDGIEGNFSANPLFCNAAQGDYHLTADSPCAPGKSPLDCGLIGAFPVGCGIIGVVDAAPVAPQRLTVIPNPVRGIARFESSPTAVTILNIFDSQGRLVDHLTSREGHWEWQPGATTPAGVYFARPEADLPASMTVKFLILR